MTTPLTTGNPIPQGCKCWMVRGADQPYREICDSFSPNPFATVEFEGKRHELCHDCEHLEPCHSL